MSDFLPSIQQLGIFTAIRDSVYAYPVLLWLHIIALIAWGGMMLLTDVRMLVFGETGGAGNGPVSDALEGLRRPKRLSFLFAAFSGLLLFGAKAGQYADNPWFWAKMALLVLLAVNYLAFRRGAQPTQLRVAAGLSLALWISAALIARGPATVKDVMHSMVDPTADALFGSIQTISDDRGARMEGPQSAAQWQELKQRVQILLDVSQLLRDPALRAARPRFRSGNPGIENEPAEVQRLMDSNPSGFVEHAAKLHAAATVAMQAVDANNTDALWNALSGIDAACELCHLRYWYPNEKRAVQAAREAGIIE